MDFKPIKRDLCLFPLSWWHSEDFFKLNHEYKNTEFRDKKALWCWESQNFELISMIGESFKICNWTQLFAICSKFLILTTEFMIIWKLFSRISKVILALVCSILVFYPWGHERLGQSLKFEDWLTEMRKFRGFSTIIYFDYFFNVKISELKLAPRSRLQYVSY